MFKLAMTIYDCYQTRHSMERQVARRTMEIWKFKKSLLYLYKHTTKEERVCFFENTVLILEVCSLPQNIMFLTGKSSSCEVRILFLKL